MIELLVRKAPKEYIKMPWFARKVSKPSQISRSRKFLIFLVSPPHPGISNSTGGELSFITSKVPV
jgi:hypothetical protein